MTEPRSKPLGKVAARRESSALSFHLRAVWLAVISLACLVIGAIAGLLAMVDGMSLPQSLGIAGAAFATAYGMGFSAAHFLLGRP